MPHIDRRLAHASRKQREMATEAAGRLPDALARPRLLMAAADGVPEIAERAQAIWRERYADACSFDPMTGIELALLDGPPSEQMRSRLATLRNSPLEVRTAIALTMLPGSGTRNMFGIFKSRAGEESKPAPLQDCGSLARIECSGSIPSSHDERARRYSRLAEMHFAISVYRIPRCLARVPRSSNAVPGPTRSHRDS